MFWVLFLGIVAVSDILTRIELLRDRREALRALRARRAAKRLKALVK